MVISLSGRCLERASASERASEWANAWWHRLRRQKRISWSNENEDNDENADNNEAGENKTSPY